jgi:hypothetical protein
VLLPPVYILKRRHVEDALEAAHDDARSVTVWIHSSTIGIDAACFDRCPKMKLVSRIRLWGPEPRAVEVSDLRVFMAYEPDVVDVIHGFVTDKSVNASEMHCVGFNAFTCCDALREVVLPRSITHIAEGAFRGCTSLTSVALPNSLIYIGEDAFSGCTSLTSVALPNSLIYIGEDAFRYCSSLKSVALPNSLVYIADYAFDGCDTLRSVTFPDSLACIGRHAFFGCPKLRSVVLPSSDTHVDEYAFPKDVIMDSSSRRGGRAGRCVIA